MNLYLIKRGPKPEYHNAPFHPVICCANKGVARWQVGATDDRAWLWSQCPCTPGHGLLLERWEGLDIDYGHVVHGFTLPDGTEAAFHHPHHKPETWALLSGAIWWSTKRMPDWLAEQGVIVAPDDFTRDMIKDDERFVRQLRGAA